MVRLVGMFLQESHHQIVHDKWAGATIVSYEHKQAWCYYGAIVPETGFLVPGTKLSRGFYVDLLFIVRTCATQHSPAFLLGTSYTRNVF
jgi:hypothetical protein